ncbi:MAG: helix-turn-helix transcriptional regulator [Burkholderiales bacterium]|nr:helix-turn-helix transcriptional regulator [Burkholderiales bacterium]
MIRVKLQYEWQLQPGGGQGVEPILFRVLYALHSSGSVAGAARQTKLSYRHVWGLVGKWERMFGRPLVKLSRGRGAELTEFGQKLLWAEQLVQARLAPKLESVGHEIERAMSNVMDVGPARLVVCASHDLALGQLRDRLARGEGLKLDLRFLGSLDSLAALAKGQCSVAGFHFAEGMEQAATTMFRRYLKPRKHKLIGLATRTQGLMVAKDNPKGIHDLSDLTGKGVRLINRQRESGSRIEFDELLSGAGIDPAAIDGYHSEEFTHLAVAATVAGGMADAGYGIRAAAAHYGLDFIPLLTERYYLACRGDALDEPLLANFVKLLCGAELRKILSGMPGYGTSITGKFYDVSDALPARRSTPAPASSN